VAPPPLILCEADAHLGRPTLEALLSSAGYDGTGGLLPPPGGAHRTPAQLLDGVEVLGLYFSASWCAPCVETTPLLASAYASLRSRGKGLELLLVPQDRSEAAFDEYRGRMPWPSLTLGGQLPAALMGHYQVTSLPALVLLDKSGALISTDGVRLLRRHARAFPWSCVPPPQTPHLHPLYERLLRTTPVDPGQAPR